MCYSHRCVLVLPPSRSLFIFVYIHPVPTRSTSYSHLRDGFMRSMQTRMHIGRQQGTLSTDTEQSIQSPLRKLKSIFPSTPLQKHTPLDILLTSPPSDPSQSRSLIIRDMGSVENDWVATEFVLAYFEGDGPSPPVSFVPGHLLA
jgi:hypothetical protein